MDYKTVKPGTLLSDFVESFWMLSANTDQDKEIVILPDGRIDLIFSWSDSEPLHVMLMALDLEASPATLPAGSIMFAVSLKLLAIAYIFGAFDIKAGFPVSMPDDFWGVSAEDLKDFDRFINRVSTAMLVVVKAKKIDLRKKKLFQLIYESRGSMTVAALAEESCWTARQINRYFNERIGISLKEYCCILRFRASFKQLKEKRLFPEENFADQAHFIKSIKKLSGVTPKELSKNINDRFIQFSAMPEE